MLLRSMFLILFTSVMCVACKRPLAEKIEKLIRDHHRRVDCKINPAKCDE